MFSVSSLCLVGQHGICSRAQQPVEYCATVLFTAVITAVIMAVRHTAEMFRHYFRFGRTGHGVKV